MHPSVEPWRRTECISTVAYHRIFIDCIVCKKNIQLEWERVTEQQTECKEDETTKNCTPRYFSTHRTEQLDHEEVTVT